MTGREAEGVRIDELVRNIIKNENLINPKIKIQPGSEIGDGYVGINSAVEIISDRDVLKLFVKAAPVSLKFRELGIVTETFANEVFFYKDMYPEFMKFQADRCVEIPFTSVPKCYDASTKPFGEAIVMENLKEQGYVLFDEEVMNEDHIIFVLRQFARFHAVTFAFKDQNYERYEKLTANLIDILVGSLTKCGMHKAFMSNCEDVKTMFENDTFISGKIKNLTETLMEVFLNSNAHIDKYSTITHGDSWRNNMMFKYEDTANRNCPSHMKIIDWQIIRVNYPALDLSLFFYSVCSKEIMANFIHYLKIYHDELSKTMRELGSDPDILYPYSILLEHWKTFSKFGLLMSFMAFKIMFTDKDKLPNFSVTAEDGEEISTALNYKLKDSTLYKKRITDLLEHFIQNEYI